jgi:hypothetical protein
VAYEDQPQQSVTEEDCNGSSITWEISSLTQLDPQQLCLTTPSSEGQEATAGKECATAGITLISTSLSMDNGMERAINE